jgi:DNA-binding response OmpR family regulator
MNVLVVGDTNRWLDAVRSALPSNFTVHVCRDEIDAFFAQEEPDTQFDLLILANHLSNKDDGLKILREARAVGETNPIIIYSDQVCEQAAKEIDQLNGIYLSPTRDGEATLAKKTKELLSHH